MKDHILRNRLVLKLSWNLGAFLRHLAESADFDDLHALIEVNQFETAADNSGAAAAENIFYLLRRCGSGDVIIFGFPAEHQVADCAADHIGLIARFLQSGDNIGDVWSYLQIFLSHNSPDSFE